MAQSFRFAKTDGWVFVANNDVESMFPFAWWTTQEPEYSLANPYIYEEYVKNGYHYVTTGTTQSDSVFPWAAGDTYISKKSNYDIAYAAYLNVPPDLATAKAQKVRELQTKMFEVRAGKIIYDTVTYPSNELFYQRLVTDNLHYTALAAVPVGYYINDAGNPIVQVSSDLTDLQTVVQIIQNLYYECWLAYDTHYAAIQACTTVGQVQIYNILTGWPTVPYSLV